LRKIQAELQATLTEIDAKLAADAETERIQSQMAIAEDQVEHSNAMTENAQEHTYSMDEIRAQGEQVRSEESDD